MPSILGSSNSRSLKLTAPIPLTVHPAVVYKVINIRRKYPRDKMKNKNKEESEVLEKKGRGKFKY